MKIEFRKAFEKDLKKLRDKALFDKIRATIEAIETAQSLDEITNIKRLKGEDSYFRIRLGDYRLGLFLQEDTILFVRIMHRREFYRYFP